jgi:hypothetical protein
MSFWHRYVFEIAWEKKVDMSYERVEKEIHRKINKEFTDACWYQAPGGVLTVRPISRLRYSQYLRLI